MTFIIDTGKLERTSRAGLGAWRENFVAPQERSFQPARQTEPSGNFNPMRERYRALSEAERDALIAELSLALSTCSYETQERMINSFWAVDVDYGRRVAEALAAAR